ncbi:hypothetical protein [Allokutzneria albata]|uniref:Uncharacterized protein n=1 Tax=Allokutzneria albata TaxID=211114 RepID=A0A1G9U9M8_ALLAB|nr:hypothetical protein [Allokutzneria albata]SDM56696.1 hypothetical protein SAMN04489726_2288 [Allokutzneria albata]
MAEGWGLYRPLRRNGKQTCAVELRYGRSRVRTLAFEAAGNRWRSHRQRQAVTFTVSGTRVLVTLVAAVTITEGVTLAP